MTDESSIIARLSPAEIAHWIERGWAIPFGQERRWPMIAEREFSRRYEAVRQRHEARRKEDRQRRLVWCAA